jgi:uncharacterized protein (TIRG00374 family)
LGLGLVLIWYSLKDLTGTDIQNLKSLIYDANWVLVLFCVLILVLSHYIRALRWTTMIGATGKKPGILNVFLAVITGFFFNLVFPRLGEVMKCTVLGKYEKIPVDRLIGTMVAERLIDLFCLILVIFFTIISQLNRVSAYAEEFLSLLSSKLENNGYLLAILALGSIFFCFAVFLLFRQKNKFTWLHSVKKTIQGFYEGLISIKNIQNKLAFFFHTFLIWFLYLMSIQVGFYAMPELSDKGLTVSLTILTFGSFAMIITQGGIGAYQLAVQKTLTLFGVNTVTGLAFGWLLWSVQTLMLLTLGPVSLVLLYFINRKKSNVS